MYIEERSLKRFFTPRCLCSAAVPVHIAYTLDITLSMVGVGAENAQGKRCPSRAYVLAERKTTKLCRLNQVLSITISSV